VDQQTKKLQDMFPKVCGVLHTHTLPHDESSNIPMMALLIVAGWFQISVRSIAHCLSVNSSFSEAVEMLLALDTQQEVDGQVHPDANPGDKYDGS
jgi:hypothetical protein